MIWLLLACGLGAPTDPDPVARSLQPWPDEAATLLASCEAEPFPELATTCRVQAAAHLAAQGRADAAGDVCALLDPGTWREECHFRVGEELAAAGQAAAAVAHCGQAGWFARRCITHAAWRLELPESLGPDASADALQADLSELLDLVQAGLSRHADPGVVGEGRDSFQAAWGRAVYRGSGMADPAPARVQGERGPALRTGWATEAVRLLEGPPSVDAAEHLLAAWRDGTVLRGPPAASPSPERVAPLQIGPHDQGLPHLPLYGGGLRLVGETVDQDATIAVLEALYGHPAATPAHFAAFLDHEQPRVRWTAARLSLLADAAARTGGASSLRDQLAGSADPVLRWLAAQPPPGRKTSGR